MLTASGPDTGVRGDAEVGPMRRKKKSRPGPTSVYRRRDRYGTREGGVLNAVRVELLQATAPRDLVRVDCCVCGLLYEQGPALALLISDSGAAAGLVCPECLQRGAQHIEKKMQWNAEYARIAAAEAEQIASEVIEDLPTLEQYEAMARWFGGPRFDSEAEAERYFDGCSR